jgi:protein-tyrosine phosphatase
VTAGPAPEPRFVALEGALNIRDLGGYPTSDGGRVRWGLVFRSGALHGLTATDVATLERLGLRVVYDLRGHEQRDRAPSILPDGVRSEHLPIGWTPEKTKAFTDLILEGRLTEVPFDFLAQFYDAPEVFTELRLRLLDA